MEKKMDKREQLEWTEQVENILRGVSEDFSCEEALEIHDEYGLFITLDERDN